MIKFFSKNLRSDRLVLKHLVPNTKNAKMIYDVLKNEKTAHYKYEHLVQKNILPQSVNETLRMMKQYEDWAKNNGTVFYIFYQNKFIGVRRLFYFKEINTLKFASVWLVFAGRKKGFAKESFRLLENIAFNKLKANRITRVNVTQNKDSEILARNLGFHLDGISRQSANIDGKFYDLMFWSKLHTEYAKETEIKK